MLLRDELFLIQKKFEAKRPQDIPLPFPPQINCQDPLVLVYTQKEKLIKEGTILFAHIVQANTILFRNFPQKDSAACVVYSTDSYVTQNPEALKSFAQLIFRYKNMPQELVPFAYKDLAATLADEYSRKVHRVSFLCGEKMVEFVVAPIWIFRNHLPKRKLCGGFLPVFTHGECDRLLTVPKEYWSDEFTKNWKKGKL